MERYEVTTDPTLESMVDALGRGEEVVIVRDGQTVAELRAPVRQSRRLPAPITLDALSKLAAIRGRASSPSVNAAAIVRALRDDDRA